MLLLNIVLYGMELYLKIWNLKRFELDGIYKCFRDKYKVLSLIRYVDDFVIIYYSE